MKSLVAWMTKGQTIVNFKSQIRMVFERLDVVCTKLSSNLTTALTSELVSMKNRLSPNSIFFAGTNLHVLCCYAAFPMPMVFAFWMWKRAKVFLAYFTASLDMGWVFCQTVHGACATAGTTAKTSVASTESFKAFSALCTENKFPEIGIKFASSIMAAYKMALAIFFVFFWKSLSASTSARNYCARNTNRRSSFFSYQTAWFTLASNSIFSASIFVKLRNWFWDFADVAALLSYNIVSHDVALHERVTCGQGFEKPQRFSRPTFVVGGAHV
jgi:hypothetical protein